MNWWHADKRTGAYPPLRVLWNLWFLPLAVAGCLFVVTVYIRNGPRDAARAWRSLW